MARVEFRWSEDLLARVDEARGDVPRAAWVRRVVETALNRADGRRLHREAAGSVVFVPDTADGRPGPAVVPGPRAHLPTCKCPVCS